MWLEGSWYTAQWLNMVKISKCCTDALSWLLRFQLIKWSFCKPIDRYSCRFSIKGASGEAAYSELMRKVLIKVAICSIAFINGKNSSLFFFFLLLLLPFSSPAAMGVTEVVTVSTVSSVFQHVHPRPALFHEIFLARTVECLQCLFMKISF